MKSISLNQLRWYFIGFLIMIVIAGFMWRFYSQSSVDNSSAESTSSPESASLLPPEREIPQDWVKYRDEISGIEFYYPKNWLIDTKSKIFNDNDLISVFIPGDNQWEKTEINNGARFTIAQPVATDEDLPQWLEILYFNDKTQLPDYSQETINGQTYERVKICKQDCTFYYHIKNNNNIYSIAVYTEGPGKEQYKNIIYQMMDSVVIPGLSIH